MHSDIQQVCGSCRVVTVPSNAEVCWGKLGHNCSRSSDFLSNAKHLNAVEMSAFADVLNETALSHM